MIRHLLLLATFSGVVLASGSNTREITASQIRNGSAILSIPASTDTLTGRATTDTLTNKTISFSGNTFTGTNAIANGGTGQSTQAGGFDALAPTTTKGDLIVRSSSSNVRVAVGANDYVLTADSAQTAGVKWAAAPAAPTGTVIAFAGSSCPTGYIAADGSSLLRASYSDLYAVIGTTWGAADGTHFTLPNTQAVFIRGSGSQTIGGRSYSAVAANTYDDTFQGHWHLIKDTAGNIVGRNGGGETSGVTFTNTGGGSTAVLLHGKDLENDGTNGSPRTSAETRPVNIAMLYCIKT